MYTSIHCKGVDNVLVGGGPCGKVCRSMHMAPCYYMRLFVDYLLLSRKVLIAHYVCTHTFVYHTTKSTRRQCASGVEKMRILWDINLRILVLS